MWALKKGICKDKIAGEKLKKQAFTEFKYLKKSIIYGQYQFDGYKFGKTKY